MFARFPIALWEEDFSLVKNYLAELRAQGVVDLNAYLEAHPAALGESLARLRVVDVNRAALKLYGAQNKEELLKNLDRVFGPESLPAIRQELVAIFQGKIEYEGSVVSYKLSGERIDAILHWSAMQGYEQSLARVILSVVDITGRIKIEEELRIFKESVENSSDAVGISTPEGKHYYQNKAFDELFGDIGSNPPATVYVDPEVGREVFRTIIAGGQWQGEVKMYARDRRIVTVLLRAYASKNKAGRVTALIGVHTDITVRKQTEDALRMRKEELERFERAVIGRELKMIELKKRIAELEEKCRDR